MRFESLLPITCALVAASTHARALDLATPFRGTSMAVSACAPLYAGTWCSTDSLLQGPGQSGQIVITEFMKDPSSVTDARGEWIEVYNAMPWRVNLEGWILSDDSGSQHVIAQGAPLRVAPGRYLVLGISADPTLNGGVAIDYEYSSFSLGNGADSIILSKPDGTVVDRVAYDDGVTWPDSAGQSISLRVSARDEISNDFGASWCHSTSTISATNPDTGTPSLDNDACP